MEEIILQLINVTVGYGKTAILENLNFTIGRNDFIGIVGPNGAGKTTLLRSILGSLPLLSGEINRKGVRFGYVPQRDTVQPMLPYTVLDVVIMGRYPLLGMLRLPGKSDWQKAEEALDMVGIADLRDRNFISLSGGQRQRVLIARALSLEPTLLILDEPTNGMDTPSHYALVELIENLHSKSSTAILFVSHLLSDVANTVNKIALVERDNFFFGSKKDILTDKNLTMIYKTPMTVSYIDDEYVIHPRKRGS